MVSASVETCKLNVFVQLAYGFGGTSWRQRWEAGKILGVNEPQAYGYHHAVGPDVAVVYSEDAAESRLGRLVRFGVRAITGFDFVHVWRNREALLAADVVWTHTESQTLAVLALLRLKRPVRAPKLVGQVVWLVDRWGRQPWPRRILFRWLLSRLDVLTTLSSYNQGDARVLFPDLRVEKILFGIRADDMKAPAPRIVDGGARLASLGNDEHRDWDTLAQAFRMLPSGSLQIASKSSNAHAAFKEVPNAQVAQLKTNDALLGLFEDADLIVVSLKPNRHASGTTVVQEAILRGVAVVATDAGGLRDYFGDDAVRYVPPNDAAALAEAIASLVADPEARRAMVLAGQARMRDAVNSRAYAQAHVALSRELLAPCERAPLPQKPRVAVGLATSGRPEILARLVDDLARQTLAVDKIVISHAKPSDIEGVSYPRDPGIVQFIMGGQGLPMQRNAILDVLGDDDIVLFLDDDFFPHPNYIEQIVAAFRQDPAIVGVTGRVLEDGAKGTGLTVDHALGVIAGYQAPEHAPVVDAFNTYGCNMAFRLDTVRRAGLRFDERLPLYAWYEDMDFSRAALPQGRIVRVNAAVGVHLGSKRGKTSGLRLGYSQIVNPVYLARKGTYPWDHALRSAGRHLLINTLRSLRPEAHVDRAGRARGNFIGFLDVLRCRVTPERAAQLQTVQKG